VLPSVVAGVERLANDIDEYMAAVEEDRNPKTPLSEEWIRSLATHSLNAIQFTEPLPLMAADLEEAIGIAASEFLDPDSRSESLSEKSFLRKHAALAAARQAFRSEGLRRGQHYAERVDVIAGNHRIA
jgi:hypothetical protein